MELNDALRRVVGQHWRLLAGCVIVGIALAMLLAPGGKDYSASTRLVLDTPDPAGRQESTVISDTAKAIVTSPTLVRRALAKAHADRGDPVAYAGQHVSITGLGTSGILQLSVTDQSPRVAAAVANELAALLINTRLSVTSGETQQVLAELDRRTADLSRRISRADETIATLDVRIARAGAARASALRSQRDATQNTRDFVAQQRGVLESEQISLLSANAARPRPSIISAATPPAKRAPSHLISYLMLGFLLGLVLGLGVAGLIETVRPTLVGSETLADELDAALLGTFTFDAPTSSALNIGARLRLAAEAAQVRNVALVPVGPEADLERIAALLNSPTAAVTIAENGASGPHAHTLRIGRFNPVSPPFNNGSRSGLVVISPSALKKTELNDVVHLLKATHLPLLGLIAYDPTGDGGLKSTLNRLREVVS